MKCKIKIIVVVVGTLAHFFIGTFTQAQTLSPKVIASAGGYQSSASGSLSFTIGETNTHTLSSATHKLTQGFQQPFKATLNLKLFLQGYYTSGGQMENVLFNQGITAIPGNQCDTIEIQLRQATVPYNLVSASKSVLQTNGSITFGGQANLGSSYYIVIKHRNTIESWSANPVVITENTFYDFSVGAHKAFGNNQTAVESGVWALYTGELNADDNIDLLDIGIVETDIDLFLSGYYATDINGDGNVDLLDVTPVEINVNAFVFSAHP